MSGNADRSVHELRMIINSTNGLRLSNLFARPLFLLHALCEAYLLRFITMIFVSRYANTSSIYLQN